MIKSLINNKRGSLSVEASIIFAVLMIILLGVSDLSRTMIKKERLDRMSYSFSSLVREKRLYKDAKLDEESAEILYESAKVLFKDYIENSEELGMVIEIMSFEKGSDKKMKEVEKFTSGKECKTDDFEDKTDISFENSDSTWTELNMVTFCLEDKTLLNPASSIIDLTSSSITVSRR